LTRDWQPSASYEALRQRAALTRQVRQFFEARGVLEVDTPLLSYATATDVHVHSVPVAVGDRRCFLQTSPEYAMKRLLAAGSGPVFQICKAFRNDEAGPWHAVEFTMLEWYRPGFDHLALVEETRALLHLLMPGKAAIVHQYRGLFAKTVGLDPWPATLGALRDACVELAKIDAGTAVTLVRSDCLDLLFSVCCQPTLVDGIHFVCDYPVCQAALARISADGAHAERFEVFIDGIEIGNAYHELAVEAEQRGRMLADLAERQRRGLAEVPIDELLLDALRAGLGDVAGIALGLDRLFAIAAATGAIAPLMAFEDETRSARASSRLGHGTGTQVRAS
jgi:elongation factor P--(R)-beta-lysine ligase